MKKFGLMAAAFAALIVGTDATQAADDGQDAAVAAEVKVKAIAIKLSFGGVNPQQLEANGFFPVGDAGFTPHPAGGQGLGTALFHAHELGQSLANWCVQGLSKEVIQTSMKKLFEVQALRGKFIQAVSMKNIGYIKAMIGILTQSRAAGKALPTEFKKHAAAFFKQLDPRALTSQYMVANMHLIEKPSAARAGVLGAPPAPKKMKKTNDTNASSASKDDEHETTSTAIPGS